ncbi:MAG: DNA primase [Calditrichaeota bacterium]|nr:DNA primase [Calditrichota bacterium]
MPIDDDLIRRVRDASDIVEIVSEYVSLKKRGRVNWFGLSPFVDEKTPSFSVHEERQIFHDFSSGEGGNVFTFLMKMEGITFPEAVRRLADRAGIKVEEKRGPGAGETDEIYRANELAAKFYRHHLVEGAGADSIAAREYLERRGISREIAEKFRLGLAPAEWDSLLKLARRRKHRDHVLVKAGLVRRSEKTGGHYDWFRGRLMFPIFNAGGRVVGFGGRIMEEDAENPQPKYINTPETPVYHKGRLLYGLAQARGAIRQQGAGVFVEGYTDVLAMHEAGFDHAVAGLGTALTSEQAALVKRFAKRAVLLYDADAAGNIAANRGADVLAGSGLDVRIALLPPGEDPDSLLKSEGPDAMQAALVGAMPLVDFKLDYFRRRGALETPQGRSEAARAIIDTLIRIEDEITRQLALHDAAEKLGVEEKLLARELAREKRKSSGRARAVREEEKAPATGDEKMLRDLLRVLVHHPERRGDVFSFLRSGELGDHRLRPVFETIEAAHIEGREIREADLYDRFAEQDHLVRLIGSTLNQAPPDDAEFVEAVLAGAPDVLRMRAIEHELAEIRERLQKGESGPDDLRRRQQLIGERQAIKNRRARLTGPT